MRRKNLKLNLALVPSQKFLRCVIAIHTLASVASLSLHIAAAFHLISVCIIAASLCFQLRRYNRYSSVRYLYLDGQTIRLNYLDTNLVIREEIGELIPSTWILPGLCVLYYHNPQNGKMSLPVFADSVSKDNFRKLRIFALRGPLLQTGSRDDSLPKLHSH
jgi:hypothetical protein